MHREGVGVALGARVGHVVTYRGLPKESLIYTVFTKKCQKQSKRGYPLFLTGKLNAPPTGSHFRPGGPSRVDLLPLLVHLMGSKIDFWAYTRV